MTTFFDIVQNPNMSRPNAGVFQNAISSKRRVYKAGKGNKQTEGRSTYQQSQQKSLPSNQGFTGTPNINLSNNFYFGNDDLIQNRGLLNVMNSKTANANLIPQNVNPVSENYFPKFEEIKQQINQITQMQQNSQRHVLDSIKPQFEDMKGLIQENRNQINQLQTQISQSFDPKIQEKMVDQISQLRAEISNDIDDVQQLTRELNIEQSREIQSSLDEHHKDLTEQIVFNRSQLFDREILETVDNLSGDLQTLKEQSVSIGQMSTGLITQLGENRQMISEIQRNQMTTNQQFATQQQNLHELGQLVRLSLVHDGNKNPVYNQIRFDLGVPPVPLGRRPKGIKNENLEDGLPDQLPITQFSQLGPPQQPVLEENYDVSRAKQMLDVLDANRKAKESAKLGPPPQLEYQQPLLLKNEKEMLDAPDNETEMIDAPDTRPPSPVEVNMTAEVGRQLENPDDSDRPMKRQLGPLTPNNP